MKKNHVKYLISVVVILSGFYFQYRWDRAKKLEGYFIDQICLDAQIQASKGDSLKNGPFFEQTCLEMKEVGYNPYEIQQIVFRGYDKAISKEQKSKELTAQVSKDQG